MGQVQDGADRKTINLALQGGGSHGAFAWGALDRILEDERIVIEGIVGTSAGAMNAVVTAYGLTLDGNEGARRSLRSFWEAVTELGAWSVIQPSWIDQLDEEDVAFIKRLIMASGSLKDLAAAYDISYPTVRLRLDRLIAKVKVLDDRRQMGLFERTLRAQFAEGKIDAATLKTLLSAHEKELETELEAAGEKGIDSDAADVDDNRDSRRPRRA